MTRYQLSNLKVVLVVPKWVIDSSGHLEIERKKYFFQKINLSNLQPSDEKYKLKYEENWEEDFRFRVELLVSNER